MLVKAKWNVKDGAGWHSAGEVFETENDLGDGVEVITQDLPKEEPTKEIPEQPEKEPAKPKTTRRKTSK